MGVTTTELGCRLCSEVVMKYVGRKEKGSKMEERRNWESEEKDKLMVKRI